MGVVTLFKYGKRFRFAPSFNYANLRHFQECLSLQQWDKNLTEFTQYTVATDELLCLKNAGTQISMFFTSNE